MTGFARSEKTEGDIAVGVEIRAVNSRHLDLVLRIPQRYQSFEEGLKAVAARHLDRGRVEVKVEVKENRDEAEAFEVNLPRARAYHAALRDLARVLGLGAEIPVGLLASAGDIIRPLEAERDLEKCRPLLEGCLTEAFLQLDAMRIREGDYLARDLDRRLGFIEDCLRRIESESDGLLPHYQDRLRERIGQLTRGLVEIDPGRIAQEAAILAERSDISEEVVRAASHLSQFRSLMGAAEPAGRKLNFLLQELHREFNTIGSKTEKLAVSALVVEVKSELEKLREQIQNIE